MTRAELRRITLDVCTPEQIASMDQRDAELETDRQLLIVVAHLRDLGYALVGIAFLLMLILWRVW